MTDQPSSPMPGTIPPSAALAEASVDGFADLFSRDPEGLTRADRDKIVAELRRQRERLEAAEAAGQRTPKAKRAASLDKAIIPESAEDLGL